MTIKVLKEILIAKGKADSYSDGETPLDLWRALNKKSDQGVFNFIEKGFILSNGRPREPLNNSQSIW